MNKAKMVSTALKAVLFHARQSGVRGDFLKHTPLHYHVADLVAGLLVLSKEKGLDFSTVVRDAREVVDG